MNSIAISRRQWLQSTGMGFGGIGFAGMMQQIQASDRLATIADGGLHFAPKAKRVIFLFMNGGPSHVDTFDPKPDLKKHEGEKPSKDIDRRAKAGYVPSPFHFRPHGESGVVMSELFPLMAKCADDLCVIRSMYTDVPNHEPGLIIMHSGVQQPTRPSIGSWVTYGLGTENENLPGYVVLGPRRPVVGPHLWSNSFLPGAYQGMAVNTQDMKVEKLVSNLNHPSLNRSEQKEQLDLLANLNRLHADVRQRDAALESQIKAMEVAFSMQMEASEAFDISRESEKTIEMYGDTLFGRQCLLARRLSERGVRFVTSYYLTPGGNQPWDTHANNDEQHRKLCADSDQATAALLTDLKQRGLLQDTLVIWSGEFGRTPYAQPNDKGKHGRDHHHSAFCTLLAGGGVKGGMMYGATDELGMFSVENRVHVHDLHATVLYLLGINHEKLTYRYSGRDFRLTDVHGEIVKGILA
ncbi:MAG: hypothetical protein RLY14_1365 [Planctomycetota bacterium]|jgi:hypothetical protein